MDIHEIFVSAEYVSCTCGDLKKETRRYSEARTYAVKHAEEVEPAAFIIKPLQFN